MKWEEKKGQLNQLSFLLIQQKQLIFCKKKVLLELNILIKAQEMLNKAHAILLCSLAKKRA